VHKQLDRRSVRSGNSIQDCSQANIVSYIDFLFCGFHGHRRKQIRDVSMHIAWRL
jgi:hypothetical protein